MFELGEKEKEEIKGLLDKSDTPNDFLNNLIDYVYTKRHKGGEYDAERRIAESLLSPHEKGATI